MFCLVKKLFLILRSKLVKDDVTKQSCDVITLTYAFFCCKKTTHIKNYFEVDDVINPIMTSSTQNNFFEIAVENQLIFKIWNFCDVWIGC